MENKDENSRHPRNLQVDKFEYNNFNKKSNQILMNYHKGLLRFAMEATKAEDAPSDGHQFQRMDPERRIFLGKLSDSGKKYKTQH